MKKLFFEGFAFTFFMCMVFFFSSCKNGTSRQAGDQNRTEKKAGQEYLLSWNDGAARQAIIEFVTKATTQGDPGFIPVEDRIATFDNDGTLWCEQPMYFEVVYSVDAAKQIISMRPELMKKPELKALIDGNKELFLKNTEKIVAEAFVISHAGMSAEEFGRMSTAWLDTAKHNRFAVKYTEMTYLPMVELLQYLRDHQFKTYIVSGGSSAFIRQFSDKIYGIPAEQVIGTMLKAEFVSKDSNYQVVYTPDLWHSDDKGGKPVAIQQIIGKKPVLAFGNSDGDLQMLQWTSGNKYPNLCLILHHTDAEREYAYDSLSHVGTLKTALIESRQKGWVVVDMKKDFNTVFAFEKNVKK